MKNNYYIMRHGHSQANEKGIIISDPSVGTVQYGLTESGIAQVREAALLFAGNKETIICSSDFQRTRETSEILRETWKSGEVIHTPLLRERFFGAFEGKSGDEYEKVWELDKKKGSYNKESIESPERVAFRVESFMRGLDKKYSGKMIILVSHGDCLQILQSVRMNLSPSEHRSVPHLHVGEIRSLSTI